MVVLYSDWPFQFNKTVPEKVATTCTEDGHKQTTKTSTTI